MLEVEGVCDPGWNYVALRQATQYEGNWADQSRDGLG
jgi:hypothetical protein